MVRFTLLVAIIANVLVLAKSASSPSTSSSSMDGTFTSIIRWNCGDCVGNAPQKFGRCSLSKKGGHISTTNPTTLFHRHCRACTFQWRHILDSKRWKGMLKGMYVTSLLNRIQSINMCLLLSNQSLYYFYEYI